MKTPALARRRTSKDAAPAESTPQTTGSPREPVGIAAAPTLQMPKRRRRPALLAAGVILVVLGALGAYYLTQRSAERIAVIGVARDVAWGEVISSTDLVQVQIVSDPNLTPVPWSQAGSIVGQKAATDLRPGGLLTAGSYTSDQVPAAGFALVGVSVEANQIPVTALAARFRVLLVPTQGAGGSSAQVVTAITPLAAEVYTVGEVENDGKRTVDVIVPIDQAPTIAAESVAGRIAIVLIPQG